VKRWGGFTDAPSYGPAVSKGDIIGVFLDLENGTMMFSVNGVSCNIAFNETEHGTRPTHNALLKEGAAGPGRPARTSDDAI
jgi:hypothetical protein